MNPLLDAYLCKKYPKIFANRGKSMRESCMYWGIDVGDGWFYIVDALCHRIQYWCDNPPWVEGKDGSYEPPVANPRAQVVFDQVKEKFSALRIYYTGGDEYIRGLVDCAEGVSIRTCEVCGAMDHDVVVTTGWNTTLCIEHAKDRKFASRNDDELNKIWEQIEDENKRKTTPNVS